MSSNKAKDTWDDELSGNERQQRRGSLSLSASTQPPPPVPPPFHSFALQHATATKKKKQRKQAGSLIPPPLQAFAHRSQKRRGSNESQPMSDMSISGLTDSTRSTAQHIPPPFEMWPHPVNYEHQRILAPSGATNDFLTPLSADEVSIGSVISSDSTKKASTKGSKISSETRLSRRLGWGKGEDEKAAKKDPPEDSKKPAAGSKIELTRGEDAEKLVQDMLRAPDTMAITKLISRMKERPGKRLSAESGAGSTEGVVQSKYGGFEYKPPTAKTAAAAKKGKTDQQTTSRNSSNLRSILRAPSIVAVNSSLRKKGNLSFSTSRRGDDDSDASSNDSVDSLSTVKSRNISRIDSWNTKSEEDIEKGIPQIDTNAVQLPSMYPSDQTNDSVLLNSCKLPSMLFMIRMITVTALAFFAVTLVLWQVYVHKIDMDIAVISIQNQAPATSFPTQFSNLAELARPMSSEIDIPFFWHVPVAAGVMVQSILGQCYGLAQASNFWAQGFHDEETLEIREVSGIKYVNVDTDSPSDIDRAIRLDFANKNLADVVISPNLHLTSSIFTTTRAGRMFTMLRNPIERAQSMYYILTERNAEVAQMTLEEYANSVYIENNWLTRFLLNENGKLSPDHLEIAKEILRRKCLIGLAEEPLESIERFTKYFHWYDEETHNSLCQENIIEEVKRSYQDHTPPEEGGEVWNLLMTHNQYDIDLYQYARELFDEQRGIYSQ